MRKNPITVASVLERAAEKALGGAEHRAQAVVYGPVRGFSPSAFSCLMGYALRVGEAIGKGARRIGLEQIDALAADLAGGADATAIHNARRCCKMLRSMLRLLRHGLDGELRRAENARWREIARMLGHARDAQVRLETFRRLISRPGSCSELAQAIKADADAARRVTLAPAVRRELAARIREGRETWDHAAIEGSGWKIVCEGLCRSYRAARKCSCSAETERSDEKLHEWRKQVKNLWHHGRLLERAHRKKMGRLVCALEKLGDTLGLDHDLAMLLTYARQHDGRSLDVLEPLIAHRRRKLQCKALRQAHKIFDEKPADFVARVKRWWKSARAKH